MGRNLFTSVSIKYRFVRNWRLLDKFFVKNACAEFYENPPDSLVADITSQTARRGLHIEPCFLPHFFLIFIL